MSIDVRSSDSDQSKRDIPSFIEPRPPLIVNPFMRPRPQAGINLMDLFEEDYESSAGDSEWVQVYLRLKPCDVRNNLYEVRSDRHLITSVDTATAGHGRRTQHNVSKMYTFSQIFGPESNQRDLFDCIVKDNLKKLPDGHNFTLLTYGASGSGKTFTLMGTVANPGLVPRALEYVFNLVDAAQQPLYKPGDCGAEKLSRPSQEYELQSVQRLRQISAPQRDRYRRTSIRLRNDLTASTLDLTTRARHYVWVSFIEIYNEAIFDLLTNCDRSKSTSKLRIREDANGNAYVKGATQAFVRSSTEAYDVLLAGKHSLQVAATGVHAHSSRSHCIFTITLLTETDGSVRPSCVRLCDLAGCERARRTRNTGARMQESRAINASLHVLERCLRMLKRKQRQRQDSALVPYRESKLTRLLGAGLSGARGESVTMVVTLNPAPECAHETRHVLQLAAVARDIQVNNTIASLTCNTESLEGSQDTIVDSSEETMRLRADNERLHYELIQAQSCIKELRASMLRKQEETAGKMYEIAEDAKDMMRQYYEAQLEAARVEMADMQEEYESRLAETESIHVPRVSAGGGTPLRTLQREVSELTLKSAVLEEELTEERLARGRLEDEVQRLLACLDERDERAGSALPDEEEIVLSDDSESEEDEIDPENESLEPTFKKKDLDRTRQLQQSLVVNSLDDSAQDSDEDLVSEEIVARDEEEQTHDVRADDNNDEITSVVMKRDETAGISDNANVGIIDSVKAMTIRGTYFINDDILNDTKNLSSETGDKSNNSRETYFLAQSNLPNVSHDTGISLSDTNKEFFEYSGKNDTNDTKSLPNKANKSNKSLKVNDAMDVSLMQFEQLEMAAKDDPNWKMSEVFKNKKFLKEKKKFFDDNPKQDMVNETNTNVQICSNKDMEGVTDDNKVTATTKFLCNIGDDRSPSIVKDDVANDFEPNKVKKLFGESFTKADANKTSNVVLPKKHASVDIFEGFDSPNIYAKVNENIFDACIEKSTMTVKPISINFNEKESAFTHVNTNLKQDGLKSTDATLKRQNALDISDNLKANLAINKTDKPITEHVANEPVPGNSTNESIITTNANAGNSGRTCVEMLDLEFSNQEPRITKTIEPDLDTVNTHNVTNEPSINCVQESVVAMETNANMDKSTAKAVLEKLNVFEKKSDVETVTDPTKIDVRGNSDMDLKSNVRSKEIPPNSETNDQVEIVEVARKSMENMVLAQGKNIALKQIFDITEPANAETTTNIDTNQSESQINTTQDNTIGLFENIYHNITEPRATEFELLLSKNSSTINIDLGNDDDKPKYNLRHKINTSIDKKPTVTEEVILETQVKCELKPPKRNLRLRRRNNNSEEDNDGAKYQEFKEAAKLKDIVNLQKEFCDVTLDVQAAVKKVEDITSPERKTDENIPPMTQSCPAKSITRSRRKLFTPRAEPLEESALLSTDEGEERPRVRAPRPSYHRTRARRKL